MGKAFDSGAPWWLPEDFEDKAARLAEVMAGSLTPKMHMQLLHIGDGQVTKRVQTDVARSIFMGISRSPDYLLELARHTLMNPIAMAKLQGSMIPKTIEVEGEIKHHHAIVVPGVLSDEDWNRGQTILGEVLDAGWGETSPWGNLADAVTVQEEEEEP